VILPLFFPFRCSCAIPTFCHTSHSSPIRCTCDFLRFSSPPGQPPYLTSFTESLPFPALPFPSPLNQGLHDLWSCQQAFRRELPRSPACTPPYRPLPVRSPFPPSSFSPLPEVFYQPPAPPLTVNAAYLPARSFSPELSFSNTQHPNLHFAQTFSLGY